MMLTYFMVFLALKIVFIVSVFLLSKLLLKNENQALLATLFLSFTHFMGADEIGLTEVVPKNFAFAFMPIVFYLFLKDRKKYSVPCFISLAIVSYFHVFTTVPVALLFLYSHISKKEYKQALISILIFGILTAPFLFLTAHPAGKIDPEIISIVPYANLANGFLTVAKFAPIVLIGFLVLFRPKKMEPILKPILKPIENRKELLGWFAIVTVYSLASLGGIFNEKVLIATLYRSFKYVIFFSFIFCAPLASYLFQKKKIAGLLACLIITLYFTSLYYSTLFDGITKNKAAYSKEVGDVVKLGDWIDKNTVKNETLMAPPDWGVIRVWGKRPLVFADTDSYILLFSSDKFPDKQFYKDLSSAYRNSDARSIIKLAGQKKISYIITYKTQLQADLKYEAGNFKVYYFENGFVNKR